MNLFVEEPFFYICEFGGVGFLQVKLCFVFI